MASTDSLKLRKLLSSGVVVQAGTDGSVAIRMMYQGTGAVTSVVVNVGTSLVTTTTEGVKTYTFASTPGCTTIGGLVAAINADGIFQAKVLDCLQTLVTSGNNLKAASLTTPTYDGLGNPVFDIVMSSSVDLQIGVCLSAHRHMNAPSGHRV